MLNIFARAMMTASRCELLEVVGHPDHRSYEFDTNHSTRSVPVDHSRQGKKGLAARISMVRHPGCGTE